MADYIEPNQTEFQSGEQVAIDTLATAYPKLLTKAGSVVRELVVRPIAYLYSWLSANFTKIRDEATVDFLKHSNLTDNPIADALASNYFVIRKQGYPAKGVITLILRTATTQINAGSTFDVDGVTVITEQRIIAMGGSTYEQNGVLYVPVVGYDSDAGTFMTNIPVVTAEVGNIEIAPGAEVSINFANSSILSASLTSPITGGGNTETDAELMRRAEYNTAESGIGSYYGIKKKLANCPINVLGMNLVAGEDAAMYRARYNTVGINPGGYVDCHVKTYNQYATATVVKQVLYTTATRGHTIRIDDTTYAGLFAVTGVVANGERITQYTVSFESNDNYVPVNSARLSNKQITVITFNTLSNVTTLNVGLDVMYMPGLDAIQKYMDSSENRFIGQDLLIKAAVPITTTLACKLEYNGTPSDTDILNIKQCIADCVNSYEVGKKALNFSDIQKVVHTTYPDAAVRLPCVLCGNMVLRDGSTAGIYSSSGILDADYPVRATEWNPAICYFSLIANNVRLELI